jgi:hypothetical protein
MFSSSVHRLPSIRNYNDAEQWFNKTPQPSTRKGQWNDNQRPLKDTRSWHYRIEQGRDGAFYDVCLYSTVMARFYKPTPEGRRVMYAAHPSSLSKQFMRHVTWHSHYQTMLTTTNEVVAVPVANRDSINDGRTPFSASLWFSPADKLDIAQSAHTPHYVHRMNADDKALRVQARANAEPMITLACLRLAEFEAAATFDEEQLEPFTGGVKLSWEMGRAINRIVMSPQEVGEEDAYHFMKLAERVYDYEATKLAVRAAQDFDETEQRVSEKVLADGLWRVMKRAVSAIGRKSNAVELPQFVNADLFPRNTATTSATTHA